jgi:hypothetical protein
MSRRCRGCHEGWGLNERGEHWIVESISNPTIAIMQCPNWQPPYDPGEPSIVIEGAKTATIIHKADQP